MQILPSCRITVIDDCLVDLWRWLFSECLQVMTVLWLVNLFSSDHLSRCCLTPKMSRITKSNKLCKSVEKFELKCGEVAVSWQEKWSHNEERKIKINFEIEFLMWETFWNCRLWFWVSTGGSFWTQEGIVYLCGGLRHVCFSVLLLWVV